MSYAGRTICVEAADDTFRVYDNEELLIEVPRTTTKPIARFKVRKPEPPRTIAMQHAGGQDHASPSPTSP
jgi:hypothetical protein